MFKRRTSPRRGPVPDVDRHRNALKSAFLRRALNRCLAGFHRNLALVVRISMAVLQTTRPGGVVRKADAAIAKNYLTESELQVLHRIVNLYIELAELQVLERNPMTMCDWIDKLDELLKASGRRMRPFAAAGHRAKLNMPGIGAALSLTR